MFGQFFGDYLIKNNIITKEQFNEVMECQKKSRVKLGLIAVTEKLLTVKQSDEVNNLQAIMDKRFGDIAIEKGYLTEDQVSHLLSQQGNSYLLFVQTLIEKEYLTLEGIETYILAYQKESSFSDCELEALKSGDIDRIVPLFVHIELPLYNDLIGLAIRNVIRFINNDIIIEKAYEAKEYSFETLASQCLKGQHNIFVGFSAKDKDLLAIANPYAKEEFTKVDEDSYDAVCEFINCIDGLYASKLSHEGVDIDMLPPLSYSDQKLSTSGPIIVVPLMIGGKKIDLVISIDTILDIQ